MKTAADAAGRWEELRGAKEVKNQTIYKRAYPWMGGNIWMLYVNDVLHHGIWMDGYIFL